MERGVFDAGWTDYNPGAERARVSADGINY
jgi:hypothetical protein